MNRNERLLEIAKHYNLRDSALATRIGATKQLYYLWKSFKQPVPDKFLISTIEQFPELNARWLITGEGEMILEQESSNKNSFDHLNNTLLDKQRIIDIQDDIIKLLKSSSNILSNNV